jgi:hypothetical protein
VYTLKVGSMMEAETPTDGVSLVRLGGGMKGEGRWNLEGTDSGVTGGILSRSR